MSLMGVANKNNQELVLFCCHPQYFLKSLASRTYPSTFQPRSNFHPTTTNFLVHAPRLEEKMESSAAKTKQ
jgi:hypothetical protein